MHAVCESCKLVQYNTFISLSSIIIIVSVKFKTTKSAVAGTDPEIKDGWLAQILR